MSVSSGMSSAMSASVSGSDEAHCASLFSSLPLTPILILISYSFRLAGILVPSFAGDANLVDVRRRPGASPRDSTAAATSSGRNIRSCAAEDRPAHPDRVDPRSPYQSPRTTPSVARTPLPRLISSRSTSCTARAPNSGRRVGGPLPGVCDVVRDGSDRHHMASLRFAHRRQERAQEAEKARRDSISTAAAKSSVESS